MISPKQKQLISTYFPELAGSVNNTDALLSKVLQPIVDKMIVMKGDKGDVGKDGYTPIKGKDYWTDNEVNQVVAYILSQATPVKGKDYFDGESIKGDRGERGNDGKNGRDGRDGKDAVIIDTKELLKPFEKKIDAGMALIQGRIKLIDQRWHGGGLSKVSHDTTLSGSGTPSDPLIVVGGSGSGWTVSTPSGTLYNQDTGTDGLNFTSVGTAKIVWADGGTFFDGAGCTITGTSIVMNTPVTTFIRVGV